MQPRPLFLSLLNLLTMFLDKMPCQNIEGFFLIAFLRFAFKLKKYLTTQTEITAPCGLTLKILFLSYLPLQNDLNIKVLNEIIC